MREEISNRLAAVSVRDLMLVTAVQRCGGFRAAAVEMRISPSGLSHQVRKVEIALDVVLFERGTRSVVPTEAGKMLLNRIDDFLRHMADLSREADQRAVDFGGNLKIGILSTVGPHMLPEIVEAVRARYPRVSLELMEGKHEGLSRRLLSSEIDLLITAGPLPHAETATLKLRTEDFILLARSDHVVSGMSEVTFDMLSGLNVLPLGQDDFASVSNGSASSALPKMDGTNDGGLVRKSVGLSVETRARLVLEQGILCLVPALATRDLENRGNLVLMRLAGSEVTRSIAAHWRKRSPFADQLQQFSQHLAHAFEVPAAADFRRAGDDLSKAG